MAVSKQTSSLGYTLGLFAAINHWHCAIKYLQLIVLLSGPYLLFYLGGTNLLTEVEHMAVLQLFTLQVSGACSPRKFW